MDQAKVAQAFNRWMDEYTKDPAAFERTESAALRHLREQLDGRDPTYGDSCSALLAEYMAQGQG